MSLYHETATILTGPSSHGGSLKSRIYGNKDLKSPPAQVYALAFESSKWSEILKEVVENSQLLQKERKLTPALSILLVHDFLLAKKGIALPATHGLRLAVEKHKARLQSEFTRARIRRKAPTVEALKAQVDAQLGPAHPRWIRVNTLKSTVDEQLDTTFKGFEVMSSVEEVMASASTGKKAMCLDGNVPNLIAASPGFDFSKTSAYKSGAIILQDKASCFPAYLLDPRPEDGDIIDACSAPGNKTTHLTGILHERGFAEGQRILAFEKDKHRAKILEKMVGTAGTDTVTVIHPGADFLKTKPDDPKFKNVGALLLDPSCSGSGIVGRDDTPEFHLPSITPSTANSNPNPRFTAAKPSLGKRKRPTTSTPPEEEQSTIVDDSGKETTLSPTALHSRLTSLAAFQLALLLHAFSFPAATKITYSTCSIHAIENEGVVLSALVSDVAKQRGWRVLKREEQVRGMRDWPVRGDLEASKGDEDVAGGCVRAERGDGRGVMGFFVVCFVRDEDGNEKGGVGEEDGPYVRDGEGRIVRGMDGIPVMKSTGRRAVDGGEEGQEVRFEGEGSEGDGPYERDAQGRIVRGENGMPRLKGGKRMKIEAEVEGSDSDSGSENSEEEQDGGEWGGFDD